MKKCISCDEESSELLEDMCPFCRSFLKETMSKEEIDGIWEDAQVQFASPADSQNSFLDVT